MTVSSSTRKAGPFNCNDVNTTFPFTFKCFTSADVRVVFTSSAGIESDLTLDTDYTVSLNADQNAFPGGTIETLTAYATGEKITVVSDVDFLQETDIQNQGGFYPEVIENALDKVTMLVQQVKEEVDRSVKVDVSSSIVPEDYLSQAAAAATNAAASASAASASAIAADASADAAAVSASEIVGFEWAGSWVTANAYVANNLVSESGNTYIALSDHTSGTFSTDFGNGLWAIFALKGAAGDGTGDMLAANNLSEVNPNIARTNLSAAKSGAITGSGLTQSTNKILGRATAGSGDVEELGIGSGLSLSGTNLTATITSGIAATASGTSVDFTGIPAWVKRITIMFSEVSTSGTSAKLVQLGSGTIVTTGYTGSGGNANASVNYTTGFGLYSITAAIKMFGHITITNIHGNVWVGSWVFGVTGATTPNWGGGSVTLSGTLDRVRITTVNGTDTFDDGKINIIYE